MTSTVKFTQQQLNAYQWERQGFARTRPWDESAALSADPGHYGTGPTLFPALLARYASLRFGAVEKSLYEERSLVRLRAMRFSLFAVPQPLVAAVFQSTYRSAMANLQTALRRSGISAEEYAGLSERICAALLGQSLTVAQLKAALSPISPEVDRAFGQIRSMLCAEGRIVRARVRSGWKSDTCDYALFHDWQPSVDLHGLTQPQAGATLALAYFDALGPATLEDFRWWSGFKAGDAAQAVDAILPELATVEIDGLPGEHLLPRTRLAELRATPAKVRGVRLLPVWDSYTMAYRRRERYLLPEWSDRIFDAVGNATSALLVDGIIGGVWDWWQEGKQVTVAAAPFAPWGDETEAAFTQEARNFVAAAVAPGVPVQVIVTGAPGTLLGGSQNLFKAPLPYLRTAKP